MRINCGYRYLLVLIVLFFQGCATSNINQRVADFQRPAEYVRFFEALDRSVEEADGKDASTFPVSGFPYLRTNRFLTGLKQDLNTDARKEQWIRWLQQLDIEARKKEIRNLPSGAIRKLARELGEEPDRQILQDRVTVYYYFSHARFKDEPILQLNYVFWYSARDGPNSPWIERGPLDGLTVRISLDNDGLPFMVDIMNTCGCYHFFPWEYRMSAVCASADTTPLNW